MKAPLSVVKDKFGDKKKLVDAVKAFAGSEELWLKRTSEDRGNDRGLEHVSNAKLIRLHTIFTEVKSKFGTRAALIEEILKLQNRGKDAGMKKRLEAYPVPRLYDLFKSESKRSRVGGKAEEGAPAKAPKAAKTAKAETTAKAAPAKAEKAPAKTAKKPAAKK